jgi:hypothetical protein
MTAPLEESVFNLGREDANELIDVASHLPQIVLENQQVNSEQLRVYRNALQQLQFTHELFAHLQRALATRQDSPGYAIIDTGIVPTEPLGLFAHTLLCCLAGTPFGLVTTGPLWQHLPVNLLAAPHRFGGIGYNPLHIDVVNSTQPPDIVVLASVRTDPLGGGQTIVSNLQHAIAQLTDVELAPLFQRAFREGVFYGMSGVGTEMNPFPILEYDSSPVPRVRFTAKMDFGSQPSESLPSLLRIHKLLRANQQSFVLMPSQLLMLNQRIVSHGRFPLGAGQERLRPEESRYLRQTYLHQEKALNNI